MAAEQHRLYDAFPNSDPSHGLPFEDAAITAEIQLLLEILPERIRREILSKVELDDLIEIVLDLGRIPEARFSSYKDGQSNTDIMEIGEQQITLDEIHHVVKNVGYFTTDNRAGIPRTLHRISAMRNRQGDIVGLTCRVGKTVTGTIEPIIDIINSGKSILLLGRPGVGKTTKLREIAKTLADQARKRVVIVDTSNEIAGDGDIPHPAVGHARRMQVPVRERQKETMIEAVQNHTPEVIVVDEIGTEEEALASRTIAERGVILIGTAHGNSLENIIKNPVLSDLVGGIQTVTLGDEEAKRRATQKTVLEREKRPTFDICIEIRDRHTLAIYPDVAEAVDHLLRGWTLFPEIRKIDEDGHTKILKSDFEVLPESSLIEAEANVTPADFLSHNRDEAALHPNEDEFRIFLYAISKSYVDRILERLNLHHIRVTKNIYDANAVIALKGNARPGSKILKLAQDYEVPVYYAKTNTMPQIQRALREGMDAEVGSFATQLAAEPEKFEDETESALQEAQDAIESVMSEKKAVELAPRRSYIRRLQHELVEQHRLDSQSIGDEPNRRLKILPPRK